MARAGRRSSSRTMDLLARRRSARGSPRSSSTRRPSSFIRSQGATPAFKGYRGFPGSICASPNAMVVHGIPGRFKLSRGDILSIDIGVVYDGWVADAARPSPVGRSPRSPASCSTSRASRCSRRSSSAARQPPGRHRRRRPAARRGRRASRSCARWSATASAARCTRSRRSPTTATPGKGVLLEGAWCSPIEPMINAGRHDVRMGDDGWSIYSQDGSLAAHFEFTVAVTARTVRGS